ncbi:FAD/NAD-binding domain-containing protein [Marasmius fiardii PR-910]|nr:FAD/NAD-binding domain-containing protein [Marasmius fiardii PR-910]
MNDHRVEDGIATAENTSTSTTLGGPGSAVFPLGNFCIDEPRPMKVVVIGAGYSGIVAGIRFRQRVSNLNLTIYDANAGVGGTWFSNKYPGLACDIPSHCYQLTFMENPNWSSFFSPGSEILMYLESVVDKYKLMPYIKLQHRLTGARWNDDEGKWHLTLRRVTAQGGSEEFEDTADVLFTGMGGLSRWKWPDIEGLHEFKGKVIHSAQWETGEGSGDPHLTWEDSVKSWGDKTVGVIGVGSSAIQIVPALQPKVKRVVNYVRGKTWVSATFVKEHMVKLSNDPESDNYTYSEADKERFRDPQYYRHYRRELESDLNGAHPATLRGNAKQQMARTQFEEAMLKKLAGKPWIADAIIPDFPVACRRLTPGPGYLEALCQDNVEFVREEIRRVTPFGIENVDGTHRALDVIVCATGYDTTYDYNFPFIGRDGIDLRDKWRPHPRTYLSIAVDGFPNWFQSIGPNSAVGAGSLLILIEREVDYAIEVTLKLQRERLKSIEVKKEAVDDFDAYIDSVFGEKCRAWYKAGKEDGRVLALWPGSTLHCVRALEHPRWEDYYYKPLEEKPRNRFYWLGEGQTTADKAETDRAWYLDPKHVDIPPSKSRVRQESTAADALYSFKFRSKLEIFVLYYQ